MATNYYAVASLPDTNARQAAMTLRPSSTALLTIDSEDRYPDYPTARASPSSPYNFKISKSESLMAGFITRLAISEVVFPWCIPNINTKTAEISITYNAGAGPIIQLITLIPGFYTPATIASALDLAISTYIPGFTMVYGANADPIFAYATNSATTIAFSPIPYNTAAYPFSPQTKQLFDLLGFVNTNTVQAVSGNGNFTLCQAIRYVDIVCNQLTNSQAQKDQTSQTVARDMLCRLYLGDGAGTGQSTVQASSASFSPPGCAPLTIYRNFTKPKEIQWIPNQNIPGFLQFQVYDDAGDLLDASLAVLPSPLAYTSETLDWSMTMLVSEC